MKIVGISVRISPLLSMILIFFLTACSFAPVKPKEIQKRNYEYAQSYISWLIQKEMKKHDIKGISIALVDDQRVVWKEGFGYADIAREIPATPETVYRVASISKLFTATAAMQLAEQGKIDIDKPLETYLSEFSIKTRFPDAEPITPRTIMTHHSGLPQDKIQGRFMRHPASFTHLVSEIKNEYVAYPPNYTYSYSNLAFGLLGHMIEKVTGRDFAMYMTDEILQPMGMRHSSFLLTDEINLLLSKGYFNDHEVGVIDLPMRNLPASGLYANVLDLSRLVQMVFAEGESDGGRILKAETLDEMLSPQNVDVPLDSDLRVGLGWFLWKTDTLDSGFIAGHGGELIVFHSRVNTLPQHKLGVIVLANSASSGGILDHIASATLNLALEAKTGIIRPERNETPKRQLVHLPQQALQSYEGRYITKGGLVSISSKGSWLEANTLDKTFQLIPYQDGWFRVEYKMFGLIPKTMGQGLVGFKTVSDRQVVVLRFGGGEERLYGQKILERPIPQSWLRRVGRYEVTNQDDLLKIKDVSLEDVNGILIMKGRGEFSAIPGFSEERRLILSILSDTEAVILWPMPGNGETVGVVNKGGEERIRYSGLEFRRIPN